jgi:hypothetical protein
MQLNEWVKKRQEAVVKNSEEKLVSADAVIDFVTQWNKEYPPKDDEEKTTVVSSLATEKAAHLMEPLLVTYLDVATEPLDFENSGPAEDIPEVPIPRAQLTVGDIYWKARTDDQKADL